MPLRETLAIKCHTDFEFTMNNCIVYYLDFYFKKKKYLNYCYTCVEDAPGIQGEIT